MARNRRKKALYEVISKTRPKPGYGRTVEQLHPEKPGKDEPIDTKSDMAASERTPQWPRKPKIVQFNAGRIEMSVPYQLAIAAFLGVVLLFLVVFRLGQMSYSRGGETIDSSAKIQKIEQKKPASPATAEIRRTPPLAEKTEPLESKGNNRIVIQTYQVRAQLEPVKQYFAYFGIETEIKKIGDWYYLVTKEKYENPKKPGSDGYLAKQKIIQLGAKYKAPPGYESFGQKPFHDAYGMKFDD